MADHLFTGTLSVTDKIGIGTESPISQLHISSATAAPSQAFLESGGALLKLSVDTSGAKLGTDNAFSLSLLTNDSSRMTIDPAGNVGIGTTPTLTEKLTVNGNLKATSFLGNGATLDGIVKKTGDTITGALTVNGTVQASSFLGNGATLDGIVKQAGDTITGSLTVQNHLTVTGNLGIGTPAPSNRLDVAGNASISGDLYLGPNNLISLHYGNRGRLGQTPDFNPDRDNPGLWLEASTDDGESGGLFCNGNTLVLWSPGDNDTLRIYDEDNFSDPGLVPQFVIGSTGHVTINGGGLSFGNQTRQMINLWGEIYGIGVQGWTQYFRSDENFAWYKDGTHNDAPFNPGNGGIRLMALNGSGDLILSARTNPTGNPAGSPCRAMVDGGNILVLNWDNDYPNGVNITNGRFVSSRDLKQDIVNLSTEEATQTLKDLNPVKFSYKTDRQKHNHVGFIAEEVPDLLAAWDRKSIGALDVVAVLTKVLQEQQSTIATLTTRLNALEEKHA